jgi:hypothetical protein
MVLRDPSTTHRMIICLRHASKGGCSSSTIVSVADMHHKSLLGNILIEPFTSSLFSLMHHRVDAHPSPPLNSSTCSTVYPTPCGCVICLFSQKSFWPFLRSGVHLYRVNLIEVIARVDIAIIARFGAFGQFVVEREL